MMLEPMDGEAIEVEGEERQFVTAVYGMCADKLSLWKLDESNYEVEISGRDGATTIQVSPWGLAAWADWVVKYVHTGTIMHPLDEGL